MAWVIVYTDGMFESENGIGNPCRMMDEAAIFPTYEEAEERALDLMGVAEIRYV